MICRMRQGWTAPHDAAAYESYLSAQLFPRVARELAAHGYRGFQLLRHDGSDETAFVTLVFFDSLEAVKGFAGEDYERPVISATAQRLLKRYDAQCRHYELRDADGPRAA